MNISKFKRDVLVPLCISVAGCAIWAGIVWGKDHLAGFNVPPLAGFDVFQLVYIAVVAFVGYFFGARSRNAELIEVYADVILAWLKEHCHTACTFGAKDMAANLALPVEKAVLGLQRLHKHELVIKKPLYWEYSAMSARAILPGYKRLVGQSKALDDTKGPATATLPAEQLGRVLATLHRNELQIQLDRLCIATSLSASATILLRIKLWAACDLNITRFSARFTIFEKRYEAEVLANISDWFLVEEIIDEANRRNTRHTRLGPTTSLCSEIESGIFKEGHHQPNWAAFVVPLPYLGDEGAVKEVKLTFYDKKGILKTETFTDWPRTTDRIHHMEFKRVD
jgi:hypothetical protein